MNYFGKLLIFIVLFYGLFAKAINVQSNDGARQKAVKVGKALEDLFSCCGPIDLRVVRGLGVDELVWMADGDPYPYEIVYSVDWSPDGNYIAIGGGTEPDGGPGKVSIYRFDITSTQTVKWIADEIQSKAHGTIVRSVNWSSNGDYLAIGGDDASDGKEVRVYKFDVNVSPTLEWVADAPSHGHDIYSVDWSPDGKYLAAAGEIAGDKKFRVYKFDLCSSQTLELIVDIDPQLNFSNAFSVNWSPDGKYLAIGGDLTPVEALAVYEFDENSTPTLQLIANAIPELGGIMVFSVSWCPDGKYLAVGVMGAPNINSFRLYSFDINSTQTLYKVADADPDPGFMIGLGTATPSVDWASHGCYIGAASLGDINSVNIYKFDPLGLTLERASGAVPPIISDRVGLASIKWAPNIDYLAVGINGGLKTYNAQYSQGSARYDGKGYREITVDIESRVDAIELT